MQYRNGNFCQNLYVYYIHMYNFIYYCIKHLVSLMDDEPLNAMKFHVNNPCHSHWYAFLISHGNPEKLRHQHNYTIYFLHISKTGLGLRVENSSGTTAWALIAFGALSFPHGPPTEIKTKYPLFRVLMSLNSESYKF